MGVREGIIALSIALTLPFFGSATAQQQDNEAAERPEIAAAEIITMTSAAKEQLLRISALIVVLDSRLEELYEQRDAVDDDPKEVKVFDDLIDRLNLTLTEIEQQRDDLAALIKTLRKFVDSGIEKD